MQKLGVVSFSVKSESIRLCKVIGFLFLPGHIAPPHGGLTQLAMCGATLRGAATARWACDLWAVSTDCVHVWPTGCSVGGLFYFTYMNVAGQKPMSRDGVSFPYSDHSFRRRRATDARPFGQPDLVGHEISFFKGLPNHSSFYNCAVKLVF